MRLFKTIYEYADMIKLGHTLFALPYALSGLAIADICGYRLTAAKAVWAVLAFTGARSAAMGFNRITDAEYDAKNPRTASRAVACGRISKRAAGAFVALSALLTVFSAAMLNALCLVLSFPALAVLFGYSYCKRFTPMSHFALGAALALAPAGAWIAASGGFDWRILLLGAALFFQISAFDILYAIQDEKFDRENSLFSIPARFGSERSVRIAGALFAMAAASLFACGLAFGLDPFYYACCAAAAATYLAGFCTFKRSGVEKINAVFFNMNAACSILILAAPLPQAVLS